MRCSRSPRSMVSPLAWRLSCSSLGFPPFSWPAVLFLSICVALRRAPRRPQARTFRWPAHGRPTNERCDVRSAGVADWNTARQGNTERTLTAAAGPSPRDPYRHALAMRPPRKARPFCFLNYWLSHTMEDLPVSVPAFHGRHRLHGLNVGAVDPKTFFTMQ